MSEDFARGITSMAGTFPAVATLLNAVVFGQSSCGTTYNLTNPQNTITVTMLCDILQIANARIQGSNAMNKTNDSKIFQSLLQGIQQSESTNVENVVLCQIIADLDTQAYQVQNLVAACRKQETKSSDVAVVTDAEYKAAKHKRK